MSSRILVTGGAGFIGAAVTHALLERGDDVVVLDSGVSTGFGYVERTRARLIRADIRDRQAVAGALDGCRAIVHLAAQTSVPDSIAMPLEDMQVNVDASLGLLEAAREKGVARIVFASSNAVTAGHPPPAHEGQVPSPVSPYGAAKAAVEAYLNAYHAAYGLESVSLRFANAYGPWSAHKHSVVAAFIKAHLAGGPLIIRGGGHQTRDFVHVDDLTRLVLACLNLSSPLMAGEIFQAGTGHETSLIELARTLFEVCGNEVPIEHQPAAAGDVPRNVSDIGKAGRILGFVPNIALREGLADTLDWFRSYRRS